MENKAFKTPAAISKTIYKYLKKAIIEEEYLPSQRIQEKEIAQLFSVSTTPVREAFQKLSVDKYLSIDARRGITVTPVTMKEIHGTV